MSPAEVFKPLVGRFVLCYDYEFDAYVLKLRMTKGTTEREFGVKFTTGQFNDFKEFFRDD